MPKTINLNIKKGNKMKTFIKFFQTLVFASVCCVCLLGILTIGIEPMAGHPIVTAMMVCVGIMIAYMIASLSCRCLPYAWVCDLAGTHFPNNDRSFDGASDHSVCKKCDKEVMQDSQGNWF